MSAGYLSTMSSSISLVSWLGHLLAVWLLGLTLGWMLPRPKWLKKRNILMLTPPGMWLGRAVAAWNGLLLIREIWYRFCAPGTFRAFLRAVWVSLKTGERFHWPSSLYGGKGVLASDASSSSTVLSDILRWYVTTADLQSFKDVIEGGVGLEWEKMLEKNFDGCQYTAWRRTLPSGRTEYKSVTVSEDATAQEFMDFYLDDNTRPKWDGMITEHQLLESAHDSRHRAQVVRWLRSFPFAFLSKREYVIARRVFAGDDGHTLYGITKNVDHPAAPPLPGTVRMSTFYSMWRSRTIHAPNAPPKCETTLLHFEDFGIPENLARFAVRHGMSGFVSKMVPHVKEFIAERRVRADSYSPDPHAYGVGITPLLRSGSSSKNDTNLLTPSASTPCLTAAYSTSPPSPTPAAPGRLLRSASVVLLASSVGVALALTRTPSSSSIATPERRHHQEPQNEPQGVVEQDKAKKFQNANTKTSSWSHTLHKHIKRSHHRHYHQHHGHAAKQLCHAAKEKHVRADGGLRSHRVSHAEVDA